jgi:hypothetical protein
VILRLSQKLCTKLHAGKLSSLPLDENPLADWSATLFVADRTQYILLSNTASLYSTVFYAKGTTSTDGQFITFAMNLLREFMEDDGMLDVYLTHIAPSTARVRFGKAFSRAVTGTMNELIMSAATFLMDDDMAPHDVGHELNDLLFSAIAAKPAEKYGKPKEAFQRLVHERTGGTEMRPC